MNNQIIKAPEVINYKNAEELINSWINTLLHDHDLIIDLSQTQIIDGIGYSIMLKAFTYAKLKKLDFCVSNPNKNIANNMINYGLGDIISPNFDKNNRSH